MTRRVLIAGAGLGGLTAALALLARGVHVEVFEQASALRELGAGVQLGPNGTRVLIALGLGPALERTVCPASGKEIRLWNTGQSWKLFDLGESAVARYGAPYWMVHRGDLHAALLEAVRHAAPECVRLGAACTGFAQDEAGVTLHLASGETVRSEALIGADGVHSRIRQAIFGPGQARFTGITAWRGLVPMARLPAHQRGLIGVNWIGKGGHVVTYPLRRGEILNFVGVVERDDWRVESWTEQGTREECARDLAGWHEDVQRIIANIDTPFKWALLGREPLPRLNHGRVALLGDAAHPMLPFMAQGANMAIEDALVLARCLQAYPEPIAAFGAYAAARLQRTSRAVSASLDNARRFHNPALADEAGAAAYVEREWQPETVARRYDWAYQVRRRERASVIAVRVAVLCGMVLFLEGYDIAAIAFAIPSLVDTWHVRPAAFTWAQTMGSIGLLCGALSFGLLADRLGRKPVLIGAAFVFGIFTLLCALAGSPGQLAALRFLTGLGLGGGIPVAIALASDCAPPGGQGRLVILMSAGVSIGNTAGGLLASQLVTHFGWQWIFVVGGVLPLLMCATLAAYLPGRAALPVTRHRSNPVGALFRGGLAPVTGLLWAMNLLNLLGNYLILLWLPAILHAAGVPPGRAILGGTMYALGSILGAAATAPFVDRLGPERVLARGLALGAVAVLVIGLVAPSFWVLAILILLAGIGIGGCQHGINSLSGRLYPPAIRATGAGWALGAGRIGMIAGPALGGILLSLGATGNAIFLTAAVPAFGTTLLMTMLGIVQRPEKASR